MKKSLIATLMAIALALQVSSAAACPKESKTAKGSQPCGGKVAAEKGTTAIVVSNRVSDGRSEVTPEHTKSTQDTIAKKSKGCCDKKNAKTVANSSPTADTDERPLSKKVNAVLTSLPAMQYRVGDETTLCSKSAAAMADQSGKPIEFVVGDDSFAHKGKAIARLTTLLDEEMESMKSIQFVAGGKCHACPMTAKSVAKSSNMPLKYRVAGVDFDKKSDAQQAKDAIVKAVADVAMSYKVDGQTYGCDKMAGAECKKTGKHMTFVVGGTETDCQATAKLRLTEARIRKMIEVAAAAQQGTAS
jgi:hypothetical protein